MSYVRPARVDELEDWLAQFDFMSPIEVILVAQKLWDDFDVIMTSDTAT